MPGLATPTPTSVPTRHTAQRHLFGATGSLGDAIARLRHEQRQRARAEALRVSGNFYVDRLVGSIRTR